MYGQKDHRMKVSRYEIFLPIVGQDDREIDGKALLINGLYGAMDIVDAETAEKIQKGDLTSLSLLIRERLALRGHITRKREEEELTDAGVLGCVHTKLMGRKRASVVILPTYDCNFRCPYCFERHRLARGTKWLGREMKPEMVEAVFHAIAKQRDKGQIIRKCTLYGGEPLLWENRETIRDIARHAKEMDIDISCVTNGYDLDRFIPLLKEFRFKKLQITVDGVGELNDRRRLHRDGIPTYDRILNNAALALDEGIDVHLRVNTNGENIGSIRELLDDLQMRGFLENPGKKCKSDRKGAFHTYFKAVTEPADSPTHVTEAQVLNAIIAAGKSPWDAMKIESQYSAPLRELVDAMKKKQFTSFSPAFCGAEEGMLVIGPDGLIYPCWNLVAMEDEAVGFTDEETGQFIFAFSKAKWRTRTSDLMEPCRTCPYIFTCRGGCSSQAMQDSGSCFRESCGERKEIFDYAASRAAGRRWEETGEEELSVSLSGALSRLSAAEKEIILNSTSQREIFELAKAAGIL